MELFYATHNKGKQINMLKRLSDLPVNLIFPREKEDILENGNSEVENAIIKAKYYSNKIGSPIIAADSGMYFFDSDLESPKLLVRRNLSNEEMIRLYMNLAKENGGKIEAYYKTGIALVNGGIVYTTEIVEEPFFIMGKASKLKNDKMLDCISYSIKQNKYFSEMNDEEFRNEDDKFKKELVSFLNDHFQF